MDKKNICTFQNFKIHNVIVQTDQCIPTKRSSLDDQVCKIQNVYAQDLYH